MLSAVAARKARLQGQGVPERQETPATRSSSHSPPPQSRGPSKSKRKQDDVGTSKPTSQKKRKRAHQETRNGKASRYFQQARDDPLKNQDDLIVLDESSDEDDASDALSLDEASSDEEGPSISFLPSTPAPHKNRRAWSPSTPFESSNDVISREPNLWPLDGPLSTFQPIPETNVFYLSSEDTLTATGASHSAASVVILKPQERLALLGTYKLFVLRGSVTLAGVLLHSSPHGHDVFAPRSSPIPVLEPLSPVDRPSEILLELPPRIRTVVEQAETALILQELHTGVSGLGKVHGLFEKNFEPLKWQDLDSTSPLGLQGVQNLTRQSNDISPMIVPASWEAAFDSIERKSESAGRCIYLVKGAKKSGKSTFARTLLNRLALRYRYVAFLESDLGQSEFTPGGTVALNIMSNPVFGPPFTHPSIPYQSHYIGDTSPRSSPTHYIDAIRALLQTYEMDVQHTGLTNDSGENQDGRVVDTVPLVINTMGWTKGLGADLTNQIHDILLPSMIFEFPGPIFEDFPAGRTPVSNHSDNIHVLEPIPPSLTTPKHSAADLRQLSTLSYFHAVFPATASSKSIPSVSAMTWNTALPLCAQVPYQLDVSKGLDMISLTGTGSEDVIPSEVFRVLNGAVVGLVSCEPDSLEVNEQPNGDEDTFARIPYSQGSSPPAPSTSTCHGLALIRSITSPSSDDATQLQLLTPIPPVLLTSASPRVIVKGGMELPIWGFLDFRNGDARVAGIPKGKVPYLKWGKGEGLGGEKRRTRRNLMRKGQS
ncbi:hypothetical protein QCA50_003488 [Cerrena zonata]|uniref:Polynucleotide 5'-hydroxyl-kinase GRC3 n=1 Tax=Cerrena zonata TaxID=2478898 RepID=A0AAW0GQ07_9APHY